MTILGVVGHRCERIGGWRPNRWTDAVEQACETMISNMAPDHVISGMNAGFDHIAVRVAWRLGIPYTAVLACENFGSDWPLEHQALQRLLLKRARHIEFSSMGAFTKRKPFIRDDYVVDRCDVLLVCWNGECFPGHVRHSIKYAQRMNRTVVRLDPRQYMPPGFKDPYIPYACPFVYVIE